MGDPPPRPQRVTTQQGDATVIVYDFHIEIEVRPAPLDEKLLQQLIDERIEQISATLRSQVK